MQIQDNGQQTHTSQVDDSKAWRVEQSPFRDEVHGSVNQEAKRHTDQVERYNPKRVSCLMELA